MDQQTLDTLSSAVGHAPWWGYVLAAVTALGALWSGVVTAASLAVRILESRGPGGAYLWDYPRLRALAHALALTPAELRASAAQPPAPPSP